MQGYHSSVLLREAMDALIPTRLRPDRIVTSAGRDAWYLDLTLGDGGHSIEILKRGGRVVGIDVDPQALGRVKKRFKDEGIDQDRFILIQGNFRDVEKLIEKQMELKSKFAGAKSNLAGAIFDLGVSSLQLESPERGFSFAKEGPLDMRMDPTLAVSALDLLNTLSRKELYELFSRLGEEKYSWRLAGALVRSRQVEGRRISGTTELARIIEKAVGGKKDHIHPATKVFQALRIAVNDELRALEEGLNQVRDLIEKNGRIVVVSFHSLEDRIVKNTFKQWEFAGAGKILTKKPIVPGEKEVVDNPRSRSAKMRVFKKL